MRRLWRDIQEHRTSASVYLAYWLVVLGLEVFGWKKPPGRPDMLLPVLSLHLLLPLIAGALAGWWRRHGEANFTSGMIAGATVAVADVAAVLANQFIAFGIDGGGSGESVFELPVLLIAVGLFGSLAGFLGATGSVAAAALIIGEAEAKNEDMRRDTGVMPGFLLRAGGGLALVVGAVIASFVMPRVRFDTFSGAAPDRAATAFAVNVLLNVLIAIALLAAAAKRRAGAVGTIVVIAGFVGLLLGAALVDAGSAFLKHGAGMWEASVACFACAAGNLGAGTLALAAGYGRRRARLEGATPAP